MKKLEKQLEGLYQSHLEDFTLELSDKRIRFKTTKTEISQFDELIFDGVKAFFYADPNKADRGSALLLKEDSEKEALELSSIVFCDKGFGEFAIISSLEEHARGEAPIEISIPNFNLCFGEASFFIEAKSITINDNHFSLKQQH